jgi:hypothetical protein
MGDIWLSNRDLTSHRICGSRGQSYISVAYARLSCIPQIYWMFPLFALRSRTLRAFVWQPDLLLVVRYIYDCFQVRARILNPCVGVPSNQPPLAGLM